MQNASLSSLCVYESGEIEATCLGKGDEFGMKKLPLSPRGAALNERNFCRVKKEAGLPFSGGLNT